MERSDRALEAPWLRLQQAVAGGMIVVLAAPMVLVQGQVIPPLLVPAVLFAVALAVSILRARAGATTVGVLAALWLASQVANLPRVLPDLATPSASVLFLITVGMLVVPAVGTAGLIGVLRRASGRPALRIAQIALAAAVVAVVVTVIAGI
jgi:hypothetical protein